MVDYIKREDVLQLCRDGKLLSSNAFEKLAIKYIADIPSADVVPVKHGKWIRSYSLPECSLCGNAMPFTDRYCSNCGARMDGDENV